ncbi:MAG: hypothetical protein ACOY0T_04645 [Myxococcota bacterium]
MRRRFSTSLCVLALAGLAASARADERELDAKLECEPAAGAGRIRCALKVTAPAGARLAWVDALIVKTPPFARALRTRISHQAAANQSQAELLLGLVASGEGNGELAVRARAVVCPLDEKVGRCRARSRLETLALKVGASPPAP